MQSAQYTFVQAQVLNYLLLIQGSISQATKAKAAVQGGQLNRAQQIKVRCCPSDKRDAVTMEKSWSVFSHMGQVQALPRAPFQALHLPTTPSRVVSCKHNCIKWEPY